MYSLGFTSCALNGLPHHGLQEQGQAKFIPPRNKTARFPGYSFPIVDFGTHDGCTWQQWWPAMPRFWHFMGRHNRAMLPLLAKSRGQVHHACAARHTFEGNAAGGPKNESTPNRSRTGSPVTFLRPFHAQ